MAALQGARRLARVMAVFAGIGVVVAPAGEIVKWGWYRWITTAAPWDFNENPIVAQVGRTIGLKPGELDAASAVALVAAAAIGVLATTPILVALLSVRRTLLECAAGRTFSARSASSFRRFAWASLLAMPADWLDTTVTSCVVSVLSPRLTNQFSIGVGVSSEGIAKLFTVLLLVTVAHMLAEGRRMSEDVEAIL